MFLAMIFTAVGLQQVLLHPSLPSLWQLPSSFAWRERPEAAEQNGPIERSIRWGNGRESMALLALGLAPCGAIKRHSPCRKENYHGTV